MFKPNADHIEELMRAKEICESLADEIPNNDYGFLLSRRQLKNAAVMIDKVLENFDGIIRALTP